MTTSSSRAAALLPRLLLVLLLPSAALCREQRPTLVAHPLTKIDGVELATTKQWDVLAKMLRDGEKKVEGKKRKRRGDAAALSRALAEDAGADVPL